VVESAGDTAGGGPRLVTLSKVMGMPEPG